MKFAHFGPVVKFWLFYPAPIARVLTAHTVATQTHQLTLLAQVILEKTLRACPGVKSIYLLSRSRGQQSALERIQTVLNGQVRM